MFDYLVFCRVSQSTLLKGSADTLEDAKSAVDSFYPFGSEKYGMRVTLSIEHIADGLDESWEREVDSPTWVKDECP